MKTASLSFACAAALGIGASQAALTAGFAADAPADALPFSHPATTGGGNNSWGGGQNRQIAQSFTTGDSAAEWRLESITVRTTDAYTVNDNGLTLRIHEISDPHDVGTFDYDSFVYSESGTLPAGPRGGQYLTFNLGEALTLSANSSYAFSLVFADTGAGNNIHLFHTWDGSGGESFDHGQRFIDTGSGWTDDVALGAPGGTHYVAFWLQGEAVPEPGSLLLALGTLGVFGARRRR